MRNKRWSSRDRYTCICAGLLLAPYFEVARSVGNTMHGPRLAVCVLLHVKAIRIYKHSREVISPHFFWLDMAPCNPPCRPPLLVPLCHYTSSFQKLPTVSSSSQIHFLHSYVIEIKRQKMAQYQRSSMSRNYVMGVIGIKLSFLFLSLPPPPS